MTTARINGKRRHADSLRNLSQDIQRQFIAAIRKGEILSGKNASERFGVSTTMIWRWVATARADGHRISTSNGAGQPWTIGGRK